MSRQTTDSTDLAERLRAFLLDAEWREIKSARGLVFYGPPEKLGILGKYTIALPLDANRKGVSSLVHDAADALVNIYGYSQIGDLLKKSASLSDMGRPAKIVSRFIDDSTRSGSIPLGAISAYLNSMERTLYRSARYNLGGDSNDADLIAKQFTKESLFLQTSVGSFVAKVEFPRMVLRQAGLFGEEEIDSAEVASSLFSAIQFINEYILLSDQPFDNEETLSNAISLFDVDLLSSISDVLIGSEMGSIEFALELGNKIRTSSTGWISPAKRSRLSEFVKFIKDQLVGENKIDINGSIIELRSRDPEGDRNYIRVAAEFYGDRAFFAATLTNAQYKIAVDAHKNKRSVRIVGKGTRLKTQVRIKEISEFEQGMILDEPKKPAT